ncbi:metal tolerance protein 8 [Forsythia ovata]|uniref:Metal tolerance protein 8 n=1 Tax=Forsythia ovata TaxID=205694 RepID=A0ABD1XDN7_9LAMI
MGCTVREKHVKTSRKTRSVKPESDHSTTTATVNNNGKKLTNPKSVIKHRNYHMALNSLTQTPIPMSNPNPNLVFDNSGNSAEILLQRVPRVYEQDLKKALNDVMKLKGVCGIQNLHAWSFTNTDVVGTLHLHVSKETD